MPLTPAIIWQALHDADARTGGTAQQ